MRCIKMSDSGENEESCIPCFSLSSEKNKASEMEEDPLEKVMGLIRIHIKQGINLVICDVKSSDPYVVLHLGNQKVKTRIIKKSLNPEWNEDLTLCIKDPNERIKVFVYDHDTFTADDKMGDAEIDIEPFLAVVNMNLEDLQNGTIVTKVTPNSQNCLAEESHIICMDGKPIQNMFLRLRNVPCGEIELQLQWVNVRRL